MARLEVEQSWHVAECIAKTIDHSMDFSALGSLQHRRRGQTHGTGALLALGRGHPPAAWQSSLAGDHRQGGPRR